MLKFWNRGQCANHSADQNEQGGEWVVLALIILSVGAFITDVALLFSAH